MDLFEKIFKKHVEKAKQTSDSYYNLQKYLEFSNETFYTLLWGILVSMVLVVFSIDFSGASSRAVGKICGLVLLAAIYEFCLVHGLFNLRNNLSGHEDVYSKWRNAFIICIAVCFLSISFSAYQIIDLFGESFYKKEQTHTFRDAGITVTIPGGYSIVRYEKDADSGKKNRNRIYTFNPDHDIYVYLFRGWGYTTEYEDENGTVHPVLESHYDTFANADRRYLDGGFIRKPEIVEMQSMPVYKAVGKRKDYPRYSYIVYRIIRNDYQTVFTYCFNANLDSSEEEQLADRIVSNLRFEP